MSVYHCKYYIGIKFMRLNRVIILILFVCLLLSTTLLLPSVIKANGANTKRKIMPAKINRSDGCWLGMDFNNRKMNPQLNHEAHEEHEVFSSFFVIFVPFVVWKEICIGHRNSLTLQQVLMTCLADRQNNLFICIRKILIIPDFGESP